MRIGFQRSARVAIKGVLVLAGVWLATQQEACSFALNTTAVQCLSEQDCLNRGPAFANTTCSPVTKTCVVPEAGVVGCTTNVACSTTLGVTAICRHSDSTCQPLKTAECPDIFDAANALTSLPDNQVVLLGSLSPENDSVLG